MTPRDGKLPERVVKRSDVLENQPDNKKSDKQPKSDKSKKSDKPQKSGRQAPSGGQQMSDASQPVAGFDKLAIGQRSQDPTVSEQSILALGHQSAN